MVRASFVAPNEIGSAYRTGRLGPGDILLTDAVPAEVPPVAGILSLSPSTPNSHVAILAGTYGIPFAYVAEPDLAARAVDLADHRVVFSVEAPWEIVHVRLVDLEGNITDTQYEELLALKRPPDLAITPTEPYGAFSAPVDDLGPSDIHHFGGKAANYGLLRRAIPDHCRVATAFSFDLWNGFLDQTLPAGHTLREEIQLRLPEPGYPPADMAGLLNALDNIRHLIRDPYDTTWPAALQQAVLETLTDPRYGFDPNAKIRFRSSTNVEDSENFVGAGLYDSYSGCLADDLDDDGVGPCRCDAEEDNERGVFRALRRVFASFYNDNAYLERLRHGLREEDVGMAVLVHHSFPDEIELANGVATLEKTHYWADRYRREIILVSQDGATSVANPEPGVIPEEVTINLYSPDDPIYPQRRVDSNLVPLGASVMTWTEDYVQLTQLLLAAAEGFETTTDKDEYLLDFEYKKVAPAGELIVKQIRELPRPSAQQEVTTLLVGEPACLCLMQGETGEIFAHHRLKSIWHLQTHSRWLTKDNLTTSLIADAQVEYMDRGRIRYVSGRPATWPYARYAVEYPDPATASVSDQWLMHHLANPRRYTLRMDWLPVQMSLTECPVLTLRDFGRYRPPSLFVEVEYDRPVPAWDYQGLGETTTDLVQLEPCPQPQQGDLRQQRTITNEKGVQVDAVFYWPPYPEDIVAGYTAPLVRWEQTTITGLTSEPIVLTGWYSQTYKPEHHNFWEHFLFEPHLEPGISPSTLAELEAKDIRLIYAVSGHPSDIVTYGFDQTPFQEGDITNDGKTDVGDLLALAIRWLDERCDTCDRTDLTGDGRVRLADLAELARAFLAVP